MVWIILFSAIIIYYFMKIFFYEEEFPLGVDTSNSSALFSVAKRLESIYHGSKVYVGLQIPDPDSSSRRNIDIVLVTDTEVVVISVKNESGLVSTDEHGNWVCTSDKKHKPELIANPVDECRRLVSILEEYLEQRGVAIPKGYLSFKVICSNPNFRSFHTFPPEIITYDKWSELKPEQRNVSWLKGAFIGGKKRSKELLNEKLYSIFNTAPVWDRLELKGSKFVFGEFLEFKGNQDDIKALKEIRRSKVSRLNIQKISMFGFAPSTLQLLYATRDYHAEGHSHVQWKEFTVSSKLELVFQQKDSTKAHSTVMKLGREGKNICNCPVVVGIWMLVTREIISMASELCALQSVASESRSMFMSVTFKCVTCI